MSRKKLGWLFVSVLAVACGDEVSSDTAAAGGASAAPLTEALSVAAVSSTPNAASPNKGPKAGRGGSGGSGGSGGDWVLEKNWDFGTGAGNTITNLDQLSAQFDYHDQWQTTNNGGNYGAVMVAEGSATALPGQPLDPGGDWAYRDFDETSLLAYVRPLTREQTSVSVSSHDAGCGSIVAKYVLPSGGALYGKDIKWETRLRMPTSVPAYWLAIWNAGVAWNNGPEIDVMESFGTPNINYDAFHSNTVGGTDNINYSSWPAGLTAAGVPQSDRALSDWHTWTVIYSKDDSYEVQYDGYRVQYGSIHWTTGSGRKQATDLRFLLDLGWGHVRIADVNITLPASAFPIRYEVDYSRVWTR